MNIRNETDLFEDALQWLNKSQKLVTQSSSWTHMHASIVVLLFLQPCVSCLCVGLVSTVYVLVCLLIPIIGPTNIDINCDMQLCCIYLQWPHHRRRYLAQRQEVGETHWQYSYSTSSEGKCDSKIVLLSVGPVIGKLFAVSVLYLIVFIEAIRITIGHGTSFCLSSGSDGSVMLRGTSGILSRPEKERTPRVSLKVCVVICYISVYVCLFVSPRSTI